MASRWFTPRVSTVLYNSIVTFSFTRVVTVLFIYKLFKVNNKKITRILLKIMVAFFAPYIHNEFKKIMLTYKKGMSTFKKITIMSFKVYV